MAKQPSKPRLQLLDTRTTTGRGPHRGEVLTGADSETGAKCPPLEPLLSLSDAISGVWQVRYVTSWKRVPSGPDSTGRAPIQLTSLKGRPRPGYPSGRADSAASLLRRLFPKRVCPGFLFSARGAVSRVRWLFDSLLGRCAMKAYSRVVGALRTRRNVVGAAL